MIELVLKSTHKITIKGSIFISYLIGSKEFKSTLKELKSEHKKARHFVYATREIDKNCQIFESFSDDGEPKGTSGMPTLKVLQGNGVINCALITVRYFGGVLLGSGGLARAYSDVANGAIKDATFKEYYKKERRSLDICYDELSIYEYRAKKLGVEILSREFQALKITLFLEGEIDSLSKLIDKAR